MHLDSVDQKTSREFVAASMLQKLGGDERLAEHLIPKFALGCRRMTPGSDYLQSLLSPNVQVIARSAVEVTPTGLIDSNGDHTEVDVIIFATGFDTSFSPAYTVVGQDGRTLREEWKDFPKAYLSLMARNFPNMFRKSYRKAPLV
jgi:cation diffusion facilitator CzcD-associated flavoprotein CzcO